MDLYRPVNPRSRGVGHYRRPGTSASYCGRTVAATPTEEMYVTGVCQICAKAEKRNRAAEQTTVDRDPNGPTRAATTKQTATPTAESAKVPGTLVDPWTWIRRPASDHDTRRSVPSAEQHTAADLPAGTRVTSPEGRRGTVNGHDIGRVTDTDHPNHGREYVGVNWDAAEGDMGLNRRSRPFVDELTISDDGAPWGRSEDGRPLLPMGKHWTDIPELVDRELANIRARVNQAQSGGWYVASTVETWRPTGTVCTRVDGYHRTVGQFTNVLPADLELVLHAHSDLSWCLYMIAKLRDARPAKEVELHAESRPTLPEAPPADAPALLTVEDVARRLAEIAHHQGDPEAAHGMEDELHADVLRAIAAGAPDAETLAAAALRSTTLDFACWYA
ncbi:MULTISPECIES: hypothetical protein [Streptomyces]|uniref:hypothetical protein n=1 Tax=Streptomyces TaxID=1883 RepID=UPI00345C5A0A